VFTEDSGSSSEESTAISFLESIMSTTIPQPPFPRNPPDDHRRVSLMRIILKEGFSAVTLLGESALFTYLHDPGI
jgi:hypothetical protein